MAASRPAQKNVQTIAKLEHEALHSRSAAERVSDAITKYIGRMTCVLLHLVWFAVWVVVNLHLLPGVTPFDPFPFGILTLIVSGEGVLLAIIILISQNRMIRQADRRAHLDLQINLLTEQEITATLAMLQRISHHLGLEAATSDEAVQKLVEKTDVHEVISELKEQLPNE